MTVRNGSRKVAVMPNYEGEVGVAKVRGRTTISYVPANSTRVTVGATVSLDGIPHEVTRYSQSQYVSGMVLVELEKVQEDGA